jgi:quercetin dioxygenase-like cupin family protein
MRGKPGPSFDQHEPPDDGGLPAEDGVLCRRGEGQLLRLGGSSALVKVGAGHGVGSLAVMETELEPGYPGPILHTHKQMVDSFYVLDGELTVTLPDETVVLGPGDYALVPPGNAHTFANRGERPARALNVMAPGGLERYLVEVAELEGPPTPEIMARIASKYDFEPA